MHYYKRHIGDYYKKHGRFSMLEHGACTLIIDACFDREQFPTLDQAIDWAWASSEKEIEAVKFVLSKVFTLTEGGFYVNDDIQKALDAYQKQALTNKKIALEREKKKRENKTNRKTNSTNRAQIENDLIEKEHETAPNHKPLTNNHKPLTNNKKNTVFSKPSVNELCDYFFEKTGDPLLSQTESENFFNFYESKGWLVGKSKMKNWKAAVSNWINRSKQNAQNNLGFNQTGRKQSASEQADIYNLDKPFC